MGLFGSEYWTFNLPSPLGSLAQANSLINSLIPLDAQRAITSSFTDFSYSTLADVDQMINDQILPSITDHFKWKTEKRKQNILKFDHPEVCRKREISSMNENLVGFNHNQARYQLVRKIPMKTTPFHLLTLGQKQAKMMLGSPCAEHIFNQIKNKHQQINKGTPVLRCLLVGSRPESELYIKIKQKTLGEKLNFDMRLLQLQQNDNDDVFLQKLEHIIHTWNQDSLVHGILVQLPLPDRLKQYQNDVIKHINPEKDIDGLLYQNTSFIPCAAQGIICLLDWYDVKLSGKNVVVVGSSKLLGEPSRGATVTMCSIQTRDLREIFLYADVIITATGCPHLIHGDLLPSNRSLVIVDAGVCHEPPFIHGDVVIESVRDKCILITPPTGAVGKLTVAALAHNLF